MAIRKLIFFYRRTVGKAAIQLAFLLILSTLAHAQTIIPADRKLPPPDGFTFQGTWSCGDSSSAGELMISPAHHRDHGSTGLGETWTEIIEKDGQTLGHYFVAYDRDKRQFVMIDADDPAYAAYSTEGWHDRRLTLTPVVDQTLSSPWYRLVYAVQSAVQFTITWELQRESGWIVKSVSTCNRQRNPTRK